MVTKTVVLECPKCGDRKLVDHSSTLAPTLWCSHLHADEDLEPFIKMEVVEE